ncbi:RagB/SusD family nutrient uptake outer membrane protein [Sphingobacterium multivorum]|uniref:RagB/SusD family nutrient uptake outer membrane protein n=1 Tax=Sphingobacterium multivorum TaxID=28454 RepID=A0A654B6Q9_SPHMU|nr:RagB/SusD family nutrient uptake outer membrane protein [Sphingobacterium multivorum]VXC76073.1 RagB/SusD family nutrient uptake outer membrane protein [Sphingobacterium multivorum]
METKHIITFSLLAITLSFSSCNSALDLDPTSVITNASFWKSEDDAKGGLTALYVKQRALANFNLFVWGEARSEVMEWSKISGTLDYDRYYLNTLNRTSAGPSWQSVYSAINDANLILKYVPGISFSSEQDKKNILAQAFASRAFLYFVLARTWGEVPIRTEPVEGASPDVIHKPRAAQSDVFSLIKNDINEADKLFANYSFIRNRNYWSKAAVQALKADVYLWTAKKLDGGATDYQEVIKACEEVEKADVSLLANFADLFKYANKNNKEVIFAIGNKELEVGGNYFSNMYSARLASDVDPQTGEVIGQVAGGIVWTVTELVKNQFNPADKRRNASFMEWPSTPAYPTMIIKGRGTLVSGVRHFTSDFVIYRLADVILMKAEAKNALDLDPSEEMNRIRKRAFDMRFDEFRFVHTDKIKNDELILKERLLELVFEGKRWWDLVRFGKTFELVPTLSGRASEKHLEYFPISEQVLSLEPQVIQTPGY